MNLKSNNFKYTKKKGQYEMKTLKKCLALFLAILTLFSICSLSTTVFATEYLKLNIIDMMEAITKIS